MPGSRYDLNAKRRTINLTINSDLIEKARKLGINLSRTAEAAIAAAYIAKEREEYAKGWAADMKWLEAYHAEHGMPLGDWTQETDDDEDADAA